MAKVWQNIKEWFCKVGRSIKYMFVDKPEDKEALVSFTGSQKIVNLDHDQVVYYSNVLHKNDAKAQEKIQNSLCYVVIGAILIVIGIIFVVLSLKKRINRIIGFNYASVSFVLCVICLVIGALLLVLGIYKAVSAKKRRNQYHHYIELLSRRDKEIKDRETKTSEQQS